MTENSADIQNSIYVGKGKPDFTAKAATWSEVKPSAFVTSLTTELQRKTIELIKVKPLQEILPENLLSIYEGNKTLIGEKSLPFPNKQTIRLAGTSNGIILIQELGPRSSQDPSLPTQSIHQYFIIDTENETACDLSQLWSHTRTGYNAEALTTLKLFGPMMAITENGPVLVLNNLRYAAKRYFNDISKDSIPILEIESHFHEIGHMFQYTEKKGLRSLEKMLQSQKLEIHINNLMERIAGRRLAKEQLAPLGTMGKTTKVGQKERNADAFALGVTRRLREQGLDLLRDIGPTPVRLFDHRSLHSYE